MDRVRSGNCPSAFELVIERSNHYNIRDISVKEPDIEEVIRKIYQRKPDS